MAIKNGRYSHQHLIDEEWFASQPFINISGPFTLRFRIGPYSIHLRYDIFDLLSKSVKLLSFPKSRDFLQMYPSKFTCHFEPIHYVE